VRRGEIYLTNFGKKYNSEFGKIRPALIIQNDIENRNIDNVAYKGITLLPLTSKISGGDLRVFVSKSQNLNQDSEICINEICTLDITRIDLSQCLLKLNETQLNEVNKKLKWHLNV
jgi:mRNA interferase MazF